MATRTKTAAKVPVDRKLTYEEWLALPETMVRQEVVDGELIDLAAPTWEHQTVLAALYKAVEDFVSKKELGFVRFAPVDIIVRRKPKLCTRQPDLLFISNERKHIIGDRVEGGPDLVVEILSSGESRRTIVAKLKDYIALGVRECWIVSLEAETVEVLKLSKQGVKRAGLYGIGDVVRSPVLPGLALPTKKIFR